MTIWLIPLLFLLAQPDPTAICWKSQRRCEWYCERLWDHCWSLDDWAAAAVCLCGPRQQGTWCKLIVVPSGYELQCVDSIPERCRDFDLDDDGDVDLFDVALRLRGER